jgi:hypothetical protein
MKNVLVQFLLFCAAALLQPLILDRTLGLVQWLWPTRDSPTSLLREDLLRRKYAKTLSDVEAYVVLLAMAMLVLAPILVYQVARHLAVRASESGGTLFLNYGHGPMLIPQAIAGYLFAAALGPLLIRLRYRGPARHNLLWLYSLGEREEAGLGRYLVRKARNVALSILLVPFVFFGNKYTVVGPRGVDVPGRTAGWSRRLIPLDQIAAGGTAHRKRMKDEVCLLAVDGETLDNGDGDGRLDDMGFSARSPALDALQLLRENGLHLVDTAGPGETACDAARRIASTGPTPRVVRP